MVAVIGAASNFKEIGMSEKADGAHGEVRATSGREIRLTSLSSCAG